VKKDENFYDNSKEDFSVLSKFIEIMSLLYLFSLQRMVFFIPVTSGSPALLLHFLSTVRFFPTHLNETRRELERVKKNRCF
jgi:hypothetical protein